MYVQVYPAGIATPWWDEVGRGGSTVKPDTSKFLTADDVAATILMLVHQVRRFFIPLCELGVCVHSWPAVSPITATLWRSRRLTPSPP